MWLQALISFGGLVLALATSTTDNCSPKACTRHLDQDKPVCGSDGLNYPNRCHFEKARCQNQNLTLTRKGPCKESRPCLEGVEYANQHPGYSFKPQCRPDGSYAASQCHPDTGYCWCVTPLGKPLPYTSVQWRPGIKHKCGKKKSTRRRSPSKKSRVRLCKHTDRAVFNGNLISMFHSEWAREQPSGTPYNDSVVINWKFKDLDGNSDGHLDKIEYRDLRRMVKKAVKPKKCAKTFLQSCDVNSDQMIGPEEWADCLARDGMDDGRGQNTSNDNEESEEYDEGLPSRSPPHGVLSGGQVSIGTNYEDEPTSEVNEDPADCLSDRKTVLAEGSEHYLPECTPDGRYQKIQCYKSAGYCWCVNEDTGKNIPGTSVKNGTPKCDQLTPLSRPMKGCPDEKKIIFLKELVQFLYMQVNSTSSFNELNWRVSKEEQTAKWSFVMFDKNKNKMLDKPEWKAFKELVSTSRHLKKCGRKLPRYCDINKDRQISLTEWLVCLNVQQASTTNAPGMSPRLGKPNPLSVLKED